MKQDLLWEAALTACYGDTNPVLTKAERGKMNAALKQLREVGASPEDIIQRAKMYPKVMPPGCQLTIMGLVANWNRLKETAPTYFTRDMDSPTILKACAERKIQTLGKTRQELLKALNGA